MSMEGTYVCKCDLCGEEFLSTEIISLTYEDGHTSNLCKKCDEFICKFNELGHGYYASPEQIREVLARYPANNTPEKPRTDVFETFKCECCHEIKSLGERAELPRDSVGREPFVCRDCVQTTAIQTPEKPRTDAVDIHKIIDDAMEKGDRSVYILVHDGSMSIEVRPYVEERPKWLHFGYGHYKCPECGHYYTASNRRDGHPTYCMHCGEKMYGVIEKELEDEENTCPY